MYVHASSPEVITFEHTSGPTLVKSPMHVQFVKKSSLAAMSATDIKRRMTVLAAREKIQLLRICISNQGHPMDFSHMQLIVKDCLPIL